MCGYKAFSRPLPKVFLVAFLGMILASTLLIGLVEFYSIRAEKNQMRYFTVQKSNKIVDAIAGLLYKAEALAALVIQDGGEITDFERVAAILINDPSILNILIAPGGIVSRVYPEASNESLVGFNLFGAGAGNKEALLARDSGRLTLGGPFMLAQGGQALVGRLPVFFSESTGSRRFWGLVSVTLRYPEALVSVNLEDIGKLGFSSEIWRINPDTGQKQVILRSGDQPLIDPIERAFTILNTEWSISVASTTPWYQRMSLISYFMIALFISLLVGVLGQNYADTLHMKSIMEGMAMCDPLTGLPNRRGLFQKMEEEIRHAKSFGFCFAVAYMDLNSFKEINDTYGHGLGDTVLRETAYRISDTLGEGHTLARLGGDEFIALVRYEDEEELYVLCKKIEGRMSKPMRVDDRTSLTLSVSIGFAFFPRDGVESDALMHQADTAMYEAKRKVYECHGRRRSDAD